MSIGERLKEERQRLGLTQQAIADAGGVSKRAQLNYEQGEQLPGAAYLAGVTGIGVDVVYVLSGQHGSDGAGVSAQEMLLLAAYRNAPAATQSLVLAALGAAAPTAKSAAGVTIKGGKQGQVIQGNVQQPDAVFNVGGRKKK